MREFLQKHGIYVAVGALVLAGLVYYGMAGRAGRVPTRAFFFDEESGEELARPNTDVPPLMGKSGKETVVETFKYSCDGGKTSVVAYYYKFTPEMKRKLESTPMNERGTVDGTGGELKVRLSRRWRREWVPMRSEQGQQIITNINCPPGKDVSRVFP